MTEMWRGAKNRLSRPIRAGSPTCCFKSFTRSVFVAFKAGPRLKSNVASRQTRKVALRTVTLGWRSATKLKLSEPSMRPSECNMRPLHQMLTASPMAPPAIASNNPSDNNWRTIRHREAPMAIRTAISFAREVPRASNMLARFRLAMSRTAPAIAISRVAISAIGPSSSGPVLRLKRLGFWICSSRANSESGGWMALKRWLRMGSRVFAVSTGRPGRSRADKLSV